MNSVLIVDDQKTSITMLTKILSSEYTIYTAENGKDAITAAEKYIPDVILLDILMMEMDGYAVIKILKDTEKTKNIPVIFITSLNSDDNEARGLALGAADYITKPFSTEIIKLRVQQQIKLIEQLRTIEKLSMLDQLTGLPNRRSFEERIKLEWNRSIRESEPISILMIDLDLFKDINDKFGHQRGDAVLQEISKLIAKTIRRPGDFAARWGGEEYLVLLPNTDSSGAMEIAEKIRKGAEKIKVKVSGKLIKNITLSIGVNTQYNDRNNDSNTNSSKFISGADTALYDAKNNGRNKISFFTNESQ